MLSRTRIDKQFETTRGVLADSHERIFFEAKLRQVAIGFKVRQGKFTDQIGIIAFVNQKKSPNRLKSERVSLLSEVTQGAVTDVIEIPGASNHEAIGVYRDLSWAETQEFIMQ